MTNTTTRNDEIRRLYDEESLTLAEIGRRFALSRQRVEQILNQATNATPKIHLTIDDEIVCSTHHGQTTSDTHHVTCKSCKRTSKYLARRRTWQS